jgi:hypothetical protein
MVEEEEREVAVLAGLLKLREPEFADGYKAGYLGEI